MHGYEYSNLVPLSHQILSTSYYITIHNTLHVFPLMPIYGDVRKTSNHNFNTKHQDTHLGDVHKTSNHNFIMKHQDAHLHNTTRKTHTPAAAICSTTNLLTIRMLFILVRHMLLSMLILWEIPSKLCTLPAFVIVDFQGAQTIC